MLQISSPASEYLALKINIFGMYDMVQNLLMHYVRDKTDSDIVMQRCTQSFSVVLSMEYSVNPDIVA